MREIKFRAWDKINRKMSIGIFSKLFLQPFGAICMEQEDGTLADVSYDYEIMQYTGLKDKNGVEIFEGDIIDVCVFWCSPDNPSDDKHYRGSVEITENGVMFNIAKYLDYTNSKSLGPVPEIVDIKWWHFPFANKGDEEDDDFAYHNLVSFMGCSGNFGEYIEEDIEVIGNIHKNPELLNNKDN